MNLRKHPLAAVVVGMAAVGFSLRTLMASLPPLRSSIIADLGLSNMATGVLTTLPVLCMGLFAPLAAGVGARLGISRAITVGSLLVAAGNLLRFAGEHAVALYGGTFVAGLGIALVGTLLPGFVKTAFPPARAGLATGIQMFAMMGGAALSSALSVPLAGWLGGWAASLGVWGFVALVGVVLWWPVDRSPQAAAARESRRQDRLATAADPATAAPRSGLPWRSITAWVLSAYLTLQSWQFYSSLAWLSPTYVERGWSAESAGLLLSLFSAAQLVSGLAAPWLSDRVHDWRVLLVVFAGFGLAGELGITVAPDLAPVLWTLFLGVGQGAAFALGLVLLVRYAGTPGSSARLTAMGFLVSYSIAALGPMVMGSVRDASGSFTGVWVVLAVVCVLQLGLSSITGPRLPRVE